MPPRQTRPAQAASQLTIGAVGVRVLAKHPLRGQPGQLTIRVVRARAPAKHALRGQPGSCSYSMGSSGRYASSPNIPCAGSQAGSAQHAPTCKVCAACALVPCGHDPWSPYCLGTAPADRCGARSSARRCGPRSLAARTSSKNMHVAGRDGYTQAVVILLGSTFSSMCLCTTPSPHSLDTRAPALDPHVWLRLTTGGGARPLPCRP